MGSSRSTTLQGANNPSIGRTHIDTSSCINGKPPITFRILSRIISLLFLSLTNFCHCLQLSSPNKMMISFQFQRMSSVSTRTRAKRSITTAFSYRTFSSFSSLLNHSSGIQPSTVQSKNYGKNLYWRSHGSSICSPHGKMMMSSSSGVENASANDTTALAKTPLGTESASNLLNGLDIYTIYSNDEEKHPLSLYGIHSRENQDETHCRRPVLLLHGRTWSSVPVYHLLGGQSQNESDEGQFQNHKKSRSLLEMLYKQGLQPYALDFRGFGGTPPDQSNVVTPNTCVCDVECALNFISKKHSYADDNHGDSSQQHQQQHLPVLMGWSQGALVAQLCAQKRPKLISKLILYGSIYDPLVSYPPIPLYVNGSPNNNDKNNRIKNTFNAAIEDFTIEGSIPPEPATKFAEAALLSDPYKAQWSYLSQFNNLDPARISVPTLVVAGDQDPYAPMRVQASLFKNLGRGADKTWSIIADADHAVHLLDDGRDRFINIVTSFVENSKKGEKSF